VRPPVLASARLPTSSLVRVSPYVSPCELSIFRPGQQQLQLQLCLSILCMATGRLASIRAMRMPMSAQLADFVPFASEIFWP
jgi:hypothetical protein